MKHAIAIVPAAPVRKEASHRSEMVSQLLFGETATVTETREEWLHIRCDYDGYEGWVTFHQVGRIEGGAVPVQRYLAADPLRSATTDDGNIFLPLAASLPGFDPATKSFLNGTYEGQYTDTHAPFDLSQLLQRAQVWLNAPYLWGGKTLLGVDCSGFVQTVFKLSGIRLLRDAWQQAGQGDAVPSLDASEPGDLAFFHNAEGRVIHVGLLLGDHRIIHASGRVRIDTVSNDGIWNSEYGKMTHQLHSIRRVRS